VTPRGASVVIVGGGVTGLSAGWWLARAGVDVLVLEAGIVGWEASGRNGGGATHVYSPLGVEEQRLWPQMDTLLGYPTEHAPHRIKVALSEDQLTLYQTNAEIAARQGFRTEPLDRKQLRELVPIVGDNAIGGLYLHFGGHANPQRTVQGYAWALQDLGGRILQHTPVTGFRSAGGRVTAVETATAGPVSAETVVLAAGPQTDRLAAKLGVMVPLAPSRVEMICTEPLPLMAVGGVDGNGLYGRQTRRGNLVYGGGPHEWLDEAGLAAPGSRPTTPLLRSLGRRLAELFPGAAHVRVIRSWAGVVENTPDGLPILDRLTEPANVVLATMSSVGFGLSPASGKAISELVLHGQCRFADLTALRLARFAHTPPDWRSQLGWLPSRPSPDVETAAAQPGADASAPERHRVSGTEAP
jgi:sarcosine oxidase, subunit beta